MNGFVLVLASICLSCVVGVVTGYTSAKKECKAQILRIERDAQEARASALEAINAKLKTETERGEKLSQQLINAESALNQKSQELRHEITRSTRGRACLDARTVRLLNNAGRDAAADDALPKTAGAPDAAHGAAASDTDVAQWAAEARSQYELCRARLDALINYEEGRQ